MAVVRELGGTPPSLGSRFPLAEGRRPVRLGMIHRVAMLTTIVVLVSAGVSATTDDATPYPARRAPAARTVQVALTAAPAKLTLLGGVTADAFAYNGHIPGPTMEFREGDRVVVRFVNNLPEATTVHWHGMHIPFTADGSPFHPVEPGQTFEYRFTVPMGSAGTYWYHPHPNHRTGHHIARGLYGALIVRAADDPLQQYREQVVMLSDNRFQSDGSFDLPHESPAATIDRENGREGETLFVNGQIMPTLMIRSGEIQRWRVINASAARIYRLSLGGQPFLHVGSDGGLFERPVEVTEILLAPAERVELLVRGIEQPGQSTTVQTLPYDRYIPQTRPADWNRTRYLATLRYTDQPQVYPTATPTRLRQIPALDTTAATATRVMALTQGLINGRAMDIDRVDVESALGATEIWEVENLVGMDHPFHLHGFQFQVLDRNGVPEPFRSWKDVVNVPKHQTARFIVRYDDFPGKWMFHCHILDHEDHGMMGILDVH